jgi:hypothetical protein
VVYKSSILKLDEVEPIQKAITEPLRIGDLVQRLNVGRKLNEPKHIGPPMRVVQIAGAHILTNYAE